MRLVKAFAREESEMRMYAEKVEAVYTIAKKEVLGHSLFYMMVPFKAKSFHFPLHYSQSEKLPIYIRKIQITSRASMFKTARNELLLSSMRLT